MSADRIDMHRLQELLRLHRMSTGPREVARLLAMSPNTERTYRRALAKAGLLGGDPADLPDLEVLLAAVREHHPPRPAPQQISSVDRWLESVRTMWERGNQPQAIYDRLRLDDPDFAGSLSAVKRLCLRLKRERGVTAEDVVIPVETEPGEVAQVDFGYVGRLYDPAEGRARKAWVFVLTLGYSRHLFAKVVFNQRTETWIQLHIDAFQALGGVPRVMVPDNLKAAVIRAAFGIDEPAALNRSYRELARHFGFRVDPTPPRAPEKKGKVENSVRYVKQSFFRPRAGELDATTVGPALDRWVREIAGARRHGTTRRRPLEVFECQERPALLALPAARFEWVVWKEATVHADTHAFFDRRLYSAPWWFIGRKVWIRATPSIVTIYADDQRVATHDRNGDGPRSTIEEHLPEHRTDYRHRSRAFWEERADRMGEEVGAFVRAVFDSDDVLYQLRIVQAAVRHLETFPVERARAACARAQFYGAHTYGALKRILRLALDLEPLPTAVPPARGVLETPRYARSVQELLTFHSEVDDASHG